MNRSSLATVTVLCATLVSTGVASGFEGVVKWRELNVTRPQLLKLLPDSSSVTPDKVFAIRPERIVALAGTGGVRLEHTTIYIKGPKIRIDGDWGNDKEGYIISNTEREITWMVSPKDKTYMEWTREDAKAMQEKAKQMTAAISQQLEGLNLSPERRRQLDAAMAGAPRVPNVQVRPLGKKEEIAGMTAEAYEVREQEETTLGWVTKENPELQNVVKAFTAAHQAASSPRHQKEDADDILLKYGLPVRTHTLSSDEYQISELLSVKQQPVQASMFAEPAGFKKRTMRAMMQQMMPPDMMMERMNQGK